MSYKSRSMRGSFRVALGVGSPNLPRQVALVVKLSGLGSVCAWAFSKFCISFSKWAISVCRSASVKKPEGSD